MTERTHQRRAECLSACPLNDDGKCEEHGLMRRLTLLVLASTLAMVGTVLMESRTQAEHWQDVSTTLASTCATQRALTTSLRELQTDVREIRRYVQDRDGGTGRWPTAPH